jgi:hypothetical protein
MSQTNPEGRARLTRRLMMDLVCIVIFKPEYSTVMTTRSAVNLGRDLPVKDVVRDAFDHSIDDPPPRVGLGGGS